MRPLREQDASDDEPVKRHGASSGIGLSTTAGPARCKTSRGFTRCLLRLENPDTGAFFNAGMRQKRSEPTEQELTAITAIAAHEIAQARRLRKTAAAGRAEYARVRKYRTLVRLGSFPETSARAKK